MNSSVTDVCVLVPVKHDFSFPIVLFTFLFHFMGTGREKARLQSSHQILTAAAQHPLEKSATTEPPVSTPAKPFAASNSS